MKTAGSRMNIIEAVKLMKEGAKIRRPKWSKTFCLKYNISSNTQVQMGRDEYSFSVNDILAEDWEVMK